MDYIYLLYILITVQQSFMGNKIAQWIGPIHCVDLFQGCYSPHKGGQSIM